jgi:chemotaxis protein methyltransferase CheR
MVGPLAPPSPLAAEPWTVAHLSDEQFRFLSARIEQACGIRVTAAKRSMLEMRLRRRLRAQSMAEFGDYCALLASPEGMAELPHMVDEVTTNTTDFFRESAQFAFLQSRALPELAVRGARPLRVWSAACSTGEEPYTLAMVVSEFAEKVPGVHFEITATDISSRCLATARRAVYPAERVEPVPERLRAKYLMRSKDRSTKLVRIVPELRRMVTFRHLNLMDAAYPLDAPVDILFARNVFIYFDLATQAAMCERMCRYLRVGGYFFFGHSEGGQRTTLPLRAVAPATFRREAR